MGSGKKACSAVIRFNYGDETNARYAPFVEGNWSASWQQYSWCFKLVLECSKVSYIRRLLADCCSCLGMGGLSHASSVQGSCTSIDSLGCGHMWEWLGPLPLEVFSFYFFWRLNSQKKKLVPRYSATFNTGSSSRFTSIVVFQCTRFLLGSWCYIRSSRWYDDTLYSSITPRTSWTHPGERKWNWSLSCS